MSEPRRQRHLVLTLLQSWPPCQAFPSCSLKLLRFRLSNWLGQCKQRLSAQQCCATMEVRGLSDRGTRWSGGLHCISAGFVCITSGHHGSHATASWQCCGAGGADPKLCFSGPPCPMPKRCSRVDKAGAAAMSGATGWPELQAAAATNGAVEEVVGARAIGF